MGQEYYSLQEAAQKLGVSEDELTRLREEGTLRGFADSGSWRFRTADVDALGAQRAGGDADEDEDLVLLTEAELGDQSAPVDDSAGTILGMGPGGKTPSDSDVQLIPSEDQAGDSDVALVADAAKGPADSDVRLVGDPPAMSDSDVIIESSPGMPADSDVRMVEGPGAADSGSGDSDVRMITEEIGVDPSSESGVQFVEDSADGDEELNLDLAPPPEAPAPADSDVTLAEIPTESVDSALGPAESTFGAGDSGISLSSPADSGISLEMPPDEHAETELDVDLGDLDQEEDDEDAATAKDIFDDTDFEVAPLEEGVEIGGDAMDLTDDATDEMTGDVEPLSDATEEVASDVVDLDDDDAESGSEVVALEDEEVADESAATALGKGLLDSYDEDEEGADEDYGEPVDAGGQPEAGFVDAGRAGGPAPYPAGAGAPQVTSILPTIVLVPAILVLAFGGLCVFDLFRNMFTGLEGGRAYASWIIEPLRGVLGM